MQIPNTAETIAETKRMVKVLEPLFYSLITTSKHHGLDIIQISTSRAVEIHSELLILKKKLEWSKQADSAIEQHLDKMFGFN